MLRYKDCMMTNKSTKSTKHKSHTQSIKLLRYLPQSLRTHTAFHSRYYRRYSYTKHKQHIPQKQPVAKMVTKFCTSTYLADCMSRALTIGNSGVNQFMHFAFESNPLEGAGSQKLPNINRATLLRGPNILLRNCPRAKLLPNKVLTKLSTFAEQTCSQYRCLQAVSLPEDTVQCKSSTFSFMLANTGFCGHNWYAPAAQALLSCVLSSRSQ